MIIFCLDICFEFSNFKNIFLNILMSEHPRKYKRWELREQERPRMRGKERKEVTCMSSQTLSRVWTVLTPSQCPKPSHGPTWLWDTFDISSPRILIALQHPFILTLNYLDCSIKSKKLGHLCSFPFACQSSTHALRLISGITSIKIPTSSCPSSLSPVCSLNIFDTLLSLCLPQKKITYQHVSLGCKLLWLRDSVLSIFLTPVVRTVHGEELGLNECLLNFMNYFELVTPMLVLPPLSISLLHRVGKIYI